MSMWKDLAMSFMFRRFSERDASAVADARCERETGDANERAQLLIRDLETIRDRLAEEARVAEYWRERHAHVRPRPR